MSIGDLVSKFARMKEATEIPEAHEQSERAATKNIANVDLEADEPEDLPNLEADEPKDLPNLEAGEPEEYDPDEFIGSENPSQMMKLDEMEGLGPRQEPTRPPNFARQAGIRR